MIRLPLPYPHPPDLQGNESCRGAMSGLTSGIAEMLTSSADGVRNMAGLVQNHRGAAFLVVVQVTTCILFYF